MQLSVSDDKSSVVETDIVTADKNIEAKTEQLERQQDDDDDDNNDERESDSRKQVLVGYTEHDSGWQTVIANSSTSVDFASSSASASNSNSNSEQLNVQYKSKSKPDLESDLSCKPELGPAREFDPEIKPTASNDEFRKVIFAPPRTRLSGASKSAKTSKEEEEEEEEEKAFGGFGPEKPVAPPRVRKRQSMPIVNTGNMRVSSPVCEEAGSAAGAFKVATIDGSATSSNKAYSHSEPQFESKFESQSQSKAPPSQPERAMSLDHEIDCALPSLSPQPPEASNEDDSVCKAARLVGVVGEKEKEKEREREIEIEIERETEIERERERGSRGGIGLNEDIKQQQHSGNNGATILSSLLSKLRGKLLVFVFEFGNRRPNFASNSTWAQHQHIYFIPLSI